MKKKLKSNKPVNFFCDSWIKTEPIGTDDGSALGSCCEKRANKTKKNSCAIPSNTQNWLCGSLTVAYKNKFKKQEKFFYFSFQDSNLWIVIVDIKKYKRAGFGHMTIN